MRKKNLPTGIDDFREIIEGNYYFTDKSLFIEELLETKAKITLIPRPRRFGKSLNMSMLRYFFDIEKAEENRTLFQGLKIEKSEFMKFQGKYPVIYISFKDLKMDSWEECLEQIKEIISDLYKAHLKVKNSLDIDSQDEFKEITSQKGSKVKFMNSLGKLSKYMTEYYGKKPIILIDEYDTPLTAAYTNGYYDIAVSFFRNLLSGAYKSNENLEMGVMTGIMRIAKESIFSGLNNPDVATILGNRYNHFGFTEKEVADFLKYYELEYELDEVKRWYNGYKFGKEYVYNPWSIINFAKENMLENYWVNSSKNDLIKGILIERNMDMFLDLEKIFKGETVEKYISDEIIFSNLKNLSTVWSLMFFSGYLTFESKNISELTGEISYNLKIPNDEVKSFFRKTFLDEYTGGEPDIYMDMMKELHHGKIDEFSKLFQKLFKNVISYHDKGNDEKYYHHFVLALLLVLSSKYKINSNRESGYGRYDIAMFPKEKGNHGIIFEFKISKTENKLKKISSEALEQIEEMNYEAEMKLEGIQKIIKIGIAFYGKDLEISWK